jgi:integrase
MPGRNRILSLLGLKIQPPHNGYSPSSHISPSLRSPLIIRVHFSLFYGEILGLTWDKVDMNEGTVTLKAGETKNIEGRITYLDEELSKPFHDLRRAAVRNIILSEMPARVAMMISGHKTRAVFDRYNVVSGDDLEQAAAKPESYLQGMGYNLVKIQLLAGKIRNVSNV